MDADKLQRLRKNHIILKTDLETDLVLDHLYKEGVFNDGHYDHVRSKKTQADKNRELLTILKRTGNRGYDTFLQILENLGSHLAEKLTQTPLDQEVAGEELTENIFYNPSEDFELKGLIDQLTKDDRITHDQLERMKNYVIGEVGCSESIIRTRDSPQSFFRYLMDVKLVTRYNLAFLQSLLWKVDLKDLCQDIAVFARKNDNDPIFFFSSRTTLTFTENGFVPCELHVQGNVAHFKGLTIEDICYRISRYMGLPRSLVVPAGIKPSNSMILIIWIPKHAVTFFQSMDDFAWLVDLGVDSITINNKKITMKDNPERGTVTSDDEKSALEKELQRKLESEKLLKQCLYDEQKANENLRDMYDQKQAEYQEKKTNLSQQISLNSGLFCTIMTLLNLISQLLRYNLCKAAGDPYDLKERSASAYFKDVIRRAKLVCKPEILQEVLDAQTLVKDIRNAHHIHWLVQSYKDTVDRLQTGCQEALMNNYVARMLGTQPIQVRPQAPTAELKVRLEAVPTISPDLDGIVVDLAEKLSSKQAAKIVKHYKLQEELRSETNKHMIFRQLLLGELCRTNALSDDTVDRIMEEATAKIGGRRDLWEEFKGRNKKRRQSHVRDLSDVPIRLDNIEKLLKHMIAQNLATPFAAGIPFQTQGFKMPTFNKEAPYFPA